MKICGIVAEYNPFHNGHARHIAETRALLGADTAIVCVMSGDFVQRGGPAVFPRHTRAEAAVRGGADLVIELPLPWAMRSAEGFASGAASLAAAAGAEYLSFGSESGDLHALDAAAALLLRPELDAALRRELQNGSSYAFARQKAAEELAGAPLPMLRSPNDILGVEYCKAIRALNLTLTPIAVKRLGAAHDGADGGEYPSASALQERLRRGGVWTDAVPPAAGAVLAREREAGRGPVFPQALDTALLSRLRALPAEAFAALPDAGEGLERRLARFAREEAGEDAILAAAAAKRYPAARLRRMLWAAALGLRRLDGEGTPPYLRVLAANGRGREVLAFLRKRCPLPLITKPADRRLDARGERVFSLCAAAADFYVLGFPDPAQRLGGRDVRTSPIMLRED